MLEKNTIAILRLAKIFTTAIHSARGGYHAHFSVDGSNLNQVDLTCFFEIYFLSCGQRKTS